MIINMMNYGKHLLSNPVGSLSILKWFLSFNKTNHIRVIMVLSHIFLTNFEFLKNSPANKKNHETLEYQGEFAYLGLHI